MITGLRQDHIAGAKQLARMLDADRVKQVFVARDAHPSVVAKVVETCKARCVPIEWVDTMRQLGEACGIDVGAAVAGIPKAQGQA